LTRAEAAPEADVQVLALVAVGVGVRMGQHAGDAVRHHPDAGLLEDLADDRRRGLFARLNESADHGPSSVVRPLAEEQLPRVVQHHGAHAGQPQQVVAYVLP
jgi:hypothetical protein